MIRPRPHSQAVAFLCLATLAACGASSPSNADKTPMQGELRRNEAARVRTAQVVRREMVLPVTTTTNVESENEIQLFPRVSGIIVELLAEEGDRVEKDDVLARIDNREALARLRDARIALREAEEMVPKLEISTQDAEEKLERAEATHGQAVRDSERQEKDPGLFTDQAREQSKLAMEQALRDVRTAEFAVKTAQANERTQTTAIERAGLTVTREDLSASFTNLQAPFKGVIAKRNIKVGDLVSSSVAAFVLTDPDHLRAVFHRPQRDLPRFRADTRTSADDTSVGTPADGIEILATAEAIPGREFKTRVRRISPTIDASTGSFRVTIDIEQPQDGGTDSRLLPGMLVRLNIIIDRHPNALVVPKKALRREGDLRFVFVVEDGVARRVVVEEGFSNHDDVELLPVEPGSIQPGDAVVIVGNRDLEDGAEVQDEGARPAELQSQPEQEQDPKSSGAGEAK